MEQAFVANIDLVKVNLGQLYPDFVGNSVYDKDMSYDITTPIIYGDFIEGQRYFPVKTSKLIIESDYEYLDQIRIEKSYDY